MGVRRYTIGDVKPYDGDSKSNAKNVTLSVNGKKLDHISKCIERTTDLKTLKNMSKSQTLNECYIDLTLNKLRELDDDRDAQNKYIIGRSKFLDEGYVNILIVKLKLEDNQNLDNNDFGYLNSLLNWSKNDIPVMPILQFENGVEQPDQIKRYMEFVEKMLSLRSSYDSVDNLAMSIPVYVPRRRIEKLFGLYDTVNPTFIAVDFNNGRIDSKPDGILDTVQAYFKDIKEEKTFFYGINVKPYKNGSSASSALDIQSVHWSLNAIGPTHQSARKAVILPTDWSAAGKVFDIDSISYSKFIDDRFLNPFIEWVDKSYQVTLHKDYSKNEKSTYSYLKRYNFQNTNTELTKVSDALIKGETEVINDVISKLPEELKGKLPSRRLA